MDISERQRKWKWAKSGREAKKSEKILQNFLTKVKSAEKAAIIEKQNLKKKQAARALKLLDDIKKDGGPLTASDIGRMEKMDQKQTRLLD